MMVDQVGSGVVTIGGVQGLAVCCSAGDGHGDDEHEGGLDAVA